jgi:phosphoribosyl 1,2-cyclic phosphodiesterase
MKFKFWGVRGSIPTPGPHTVKYGGNTTCIEVRTARGELLILDGGTGIYGLAQTLPSQTPLTVHILLTHTHWDHIQGLPFFLPIFERGNCIHFYGADDDVTGLGIERAINVQLQHSYFPINEAQLQADVHYHRLQNGESIEIGGARITPLALNHPVVNLGYRIDDSDGSSLFFTGDYEPENNPYASDHRQFAAAQTEILQTQHEILQVVGNVDSLIVDASYTELEYQYKTNWGHGTYEGGVELARLTNAKKLYFTHHEPMRSDSELEAIYHAMLQLAPADLPIYLAKEGAGYISAAADQQQGIDGAVGA